MPSKVYSGAVVGVEAFEVEIEVHAGWGNTDKIAVVGLPDAAVKESKDRVTSAICNSALRWPSGQRITINLAPADVRKEGPSFDLPIALGMLKLEKENRVPDLDAFCISGELALSGKLRPVKGVIAIALEARRCNRRMLAECPRSGSGGGCRCLRSHVALGGRRVPPWQKSSRAGSVNERLADGRCRRPGSRFRRSQRPASRKTRR
jgi:hypothetical protein